MGRLLQGKVGAIRLLSTASTFDRNFFLSCKLQCQSKLTKIQPGVVNQKPQWKIPGRSMKDVKPAAVLVPLCIVDGVPSVLFTLRSAKLPGHQGDVSFPGGKVDAGDRDSAHTALRETYEEIGLPDRDIDLWGYLDPLPSTGMKMSVTPVVAYCGQIDLNKLAINHNEVEKVFVSSLESLCDESNLRYTTFRSGGSFYKTPLFLGQAYRIWGLTSFILHRTLRIVAPEVYKFDLIPTRSQFGTMVAGL